MTITVLGAGVIGCAVAHALAARGARVQVVDPRGPGGGATQASAGILSPYIEGHDPALLSLCVRGLEEWDRFIATLRGTARTVPYARTGTLQVARTVHETAALEALAAHLRTCGIEHTLLDGGGLRRLEPAMSPRLPAGLLVGIHGYVGVRPLTAALVDAARQQGVTCRRAAATALQETTRGVRVQTEDGPIDCDAVVVATGSWTARLMAPHHHPPAVAPIRGQLLHLRMTPPLLSRVIWGADCYLVPWRTGTVLVGASVEDVGFDERSTAGAVAALLNGCCELVPDLAAASVHRVRVGLRPATPDGLPIIGRSSRQPRVWYATGHYRTGVLLAPLTARLIADLVLDGREAPELAAVRPSRFGL